MRQTQRQSKMNAGRMLMSAALIATLSGGALALEPGGKGSDVLKGPQVQNTGQPDRGGDRERGAPEDRVQRAQQQRELRLMAYMMAIRTLQRSNDESLRLSEDQQEQLRAIADERREEMATFMEAHKDEIHELRQQAGLPEREQRGDGRERAPRQRDGQPQPENEMDAPPRDGQRRGPADDSTQGNRPDRQRTDRQGMEREEPTPEQQAAREQLRALMESAPSEKGAIEKAMAVLTVDQQSHVKKAIAEGRERMGQRRQRGETRRDAGQGMDERRGRARGRDRADEGSQRTRRDKPADD